MLLSPLGERLGEGVPRAFETRSPNLSPKGERNMSSSRVKELRSRQRVGRKPVGHLEVEPGASPALTPSCSSPPWGRGWVRGCHEPPEPPHLTSPPRGRGT